jgi:hypothetical protein
MKLANLSARIEITPECWNWTGSKDRDGYGVFGRGKRKHRAHRAMYELHFGTIPKGMLVCHSCNNRGCVNPGHLYIDDNTGNIRYAAAQGRMRPGEKNSNVKLSEEAVRAILASEEWHWVLAERYGVTRGLVSKIKRGAKWRHAYCLHKA